MARTPSGKPHAKTAPQGSADGKAVAAWSLYDFANSPFTTLVVTFVYSTFFTKVIAEDEIIGTALWSRAVTATGLAVALLSPILGAVADRGGYRKLFLLVTTVTCIGGTLALYPALPGQTTRALAAFLVANIAFEMAMVFYNAFLPDIAPPNKVGRISGYGWSLGYVGGLVAMLVAMATLVSPEQPWFGFTKDAGENVRATNLLVAGWYGLFSIPIFFLVKEDRSRINPAGTPLLSSAYRQLAATFTHVRRYRHVVRLLFARLLYNDGLTTVFAFGGIFAAGTYGFTLQEIMIFGIALNLTAGLGAFALGFLDDLLGGKRTIMVSLAALTLASLLAVAAPNKTVFWIAGILFGLFAGPNQSASRSLMARLVPAEKENEFFGFFAFSGKATAFLGPLLLGVLTQAFQSQRVGVSIVLVFFVAGAAILWPLDEEQGMREARDGVE